MNIQQQKRRRGVLLTSQGLCRLQDAKKQVEDNENGSQRLTLDKLSVLTGLDSHTLCKIFNHNARVDRKSFAQCFKAFNLLLKPDDYEVASVPQPLNRLEAQAIENGKAIAPDRQDDGESTDCWTIGSALSLKSQHQYCSNDGSVPDVSIFYGRIVELATLNQWIRVDRCRLVAITGQGGMGKTTLTAKLVEQLQDDFEYVIWRSLSHTPSINEFLIYLIQFVSPSVNAESVDIDLATPLHRLITKAIDVLRSSRCLLILDNVETILQGCDPKQSVCNLLAGQYRPDYEGYQLFLKHMVETNHQSCLVLTSRELPHNIRQRVGKKLPVRSLPVKGLQVAQMQAIFQHKGTFAATPGDWSKLVERYAGNPLMLKHVARYIQFLFGGDIGAFLKQDILFWGDIRILLNQQLERVSAMEMEILLTLAKQPKPGSFSELRSQVTASISNQCLLEGLNSLDLRSLLEINYGYISLLPILASAVIDRSMTGTKG